MEAPRRVGRQQHRANLDVPVEEYFRIEIGAKLLDFVSTDLSSRFGKEQVMVSKMLSMKPAYLKEKTPEAVWSDLKEVISHFEKFFPDNGKGFYQELPLLIRELQVINIKQFILS